MSFFYDFTAPEDQVLIGARWEVVITYYEDDAHETLGTFVGWTNPRGQIRATQSTTGDLLLDFSDDDNSVALGGSASTLTLVIGENGSAAVDWVAGFIQVEADDTSGNTQRLLTGTISTNGRVYADA
jgi:hypothetical protein